MQLKYNNYVAFSHVHGVAVNNSGLLLNFIFDQFHKIRFTHNKALMIQATQCREVTGNPCETSVLRLCILQPYAPLR